jgi:hypothetical protein
MPLWIWRHLAEFYEIVIFVNSVPGWPLAEALSNQPISVSVTFKAGIAQYRLGKVVSTWRMNANFKMALFVIR